jgi:hypothetical protein
MGDKEEHGQIHVSDQILLASNPDGDLASRRKALRHLIMSKELTVVEPLLLILKNDKNHELRRKVVRGLSEHFDEQHWIEFFIKIASSDEENDEIKREVSFVLKRVKDPRAQDISKLYLEPMAHKKCRDCGQRIATTSQLAAGPEFSNRSNRSVKEMSRRFDDRCSECTKKALEGLRNWANDAKATINSPEFKLKQARRSYSKSEKENDLDKMINYLSTIANLEMQLDNYSDAQKNISKIRELNSEYGCSEIECSLTFELAIRERNNGKKAEALETYEQALELKRNIKSNPSLRKSAYGYNYVSILMDYARFLMEIDNFQKAESIWDQAYTEWEYNRGKDEPNDRRATILVRRGQCLEKLNRSEEQIKVYSQSIEIMNEGNIIPPKWLVERMSTLSKS